MTVVYAQWSRITVWNPSTARLSGTVRTLAGLVMDDCLEHVGKGVVIE